MEATLERLADSLDHKAICPGRLVVLEIHSKYANQSCRTSLFCFIQL